MQLDDGRIAAVAGVTFGLGAAALGVFAGSRPLVGVAVYAVAAILAGALWTRTADSRGSDGTRSPADLTLAGVGLLSAVVFPALVAADAFGYFAWGPTSAGVAIAVAALYAVYGVVSLGWKGVASA